MGSAKHQNLTVLPSGPGGKSGFKTPTLRPNELSQDPATHPSPEVAGTVSLSWAGACRSLTLEDSMDAFKATVVDHAKPRHASVRALAGDLLVDSHEREQVVDPLFHR